MDETKCWLFLMILGGMVTGGGATIGCGATALMIPALIVVGVIWILINAPPPPPKGEPRWPDCSKYSIGGPVFPGDPDWEKRMPLKAHDAKYGKLRNNTGVYNDWYSLPYYREHPEDVFRPGID